MNIFADSLWIGRFLMKKVEGIVPVYPCIAPEGAPDTYCVYQRAGYSGADTKDRFNYEETLRMVLTVVAPTYKGSIEKAQEIKDRLDGGRGTWEGKRIDSMVMTNAIEDYNDFGYIQTLYFSITFDTTYGK